MNNRLDTYEYGQSDIYKSYTVDFENGFWFEYRFVDGEDFPYGEGVLYDSDSEIVDYIDTSQFIINNFTIYDSHNNKYEIEVIKPGLNTADNIDGVCKVCGNEPIVTKVVCGKCLAACHSR